MIFSSFMHTHALCWILETAMWKALLVIGHQLVYCVTAMPAVIVI